MAADLQAAYGDVNAVDMYVGFFVERCTKMLPFGITFIKEGAPYSLRGLLSNTVSSPTYWKPSTFGGEIVFDVVKTATLEKLHCQNIAGKCPLVTFRVPKDIAREARKVFPWSNLKLQKLKQSISLQRMKCKSSTRIFSYSTTIKHS